MLLYRKMAGLGLPGILFLLGLLVLILLFFILPFLITSRLRIKNDYVYWIANYVLFMFLVLTVPAGLLMLYKIISGIPAGGLLALLEKDCGMEPTTGNLLVCRSLNLVFLLLNPIFATFFFVIVAGFKRMFFWGRRR